MIAETAAIVTVASKVVVAAQSLLNRKIEDEVKKELSNIVDSILSLKFGTLAFQEKYSAIQNERDEWKKKAQDREKNLMNLTRYERKDIGSGVIVRALKPSEESAEPEHWLCDNCYTDERESTLQYEGQFRDGEKWHCNKCGSDFINHKAVSY